MNPNKDILFVYINQYGNIIKYEYIEKINCNEYINNILPLLLFVSKLPTVSNYIDIYNNIFINTIKNKDIKFNIYIILNTDSIIKYFIGSNKLYNKIFNTYIEYNTLTGCIINFEKNEKNIISNYSTGTLLHTQLINYKSCIPCVNSTYLNYKLFVGAKSYCLNDYIKSFKTIMENASTIDLDIYYNINIIEPTQKDFDLILLNSIYNELLIAKNITYKANLYNIADNIYKTHKLMIPEYINKQFMHSNNLIIEDIWTVIYNNIMNIELSKIQNSKQKIIPKESIINEIDLLDDSE